MFSRAMLYDLTDRLEVKYLYFSVTCFLGIEERLGWFFCWFEKYVCYIFTATEFFFFFTSMRLIFSVL